MTRSIAQKMEMAGPTTRSKTSLMAKYSQEEMDAAMTLVGMRVTLRGEEREVCHAKQQPQQQEQQRQRPRRSCANY
jgi:hypothetical protein